MGNKTLESIFKDIDVLGINGGYSVEQLLSPQDCRMLKSTIKNLQDRIDKATEIIEPFVEWGECTINGKILKEIYDKLKGE